MLDFEDKELVDKWLDPEFQNVEEFEEILEPQSQEDHEGDEDWQAQQVG